MRIGDRSVLSLWLGLIVLANGLLLVSLLLPLTPLIGLLVLTSLCAVSLVFRQTRAALSLIKSSLSAVHALGILMLAIGIASLMTRPVTWFDTGLYHYQSIQWLANYGTVPGIALLLSNLGFTSSWFALAAPFNASILDARVSAVTNGFVVYLASLHLWISLRRCIKHQAHLSDWFAIVILSLLFLFLLGLNSLSEILVSPSPDIPCMVLTDVVAWFILVSASSSGHSDTAYSLISSTNHLTPHRIDSSENGNTALIALFLAAGTVTIKLIALPLLLVTGLFYLISSRSHLSLVFKGGLTAGLLLLPLLSCSIVTSGCPLFPSTSICFALPWLPTPEKLQVVAEHTHHPTTWSTPTSASQTWFTTLQQWFTSNPSRRFMPALLGVSFGCSAALAGNLLFGRRSMQAARSAQIWLIAVGISGIVFLLRLSPFFRFMIAYILISPALMIALLLNSKSNKKLLEAGLRHFSSSKTLLLLKPLSLSLMLVGLVAFNLTRHYDRLLLPAPIEPVETFQRQVNDVTYFFPRQGLCWATELPCTMAISTDIQLREPTLGIGSGFVRSGADK